MEQYYKGKVVLITAAATGIGLEMSKEFSRAGATVILTSRNDEHIKSGVKSIKDEGGLAWGQVCHVGKQQDREALYQKIKKEGVVVDVVILNAAVSTHFGDFLEMKSHQMDKMYDINIKATILMA